MPIKKPIVYSKTLTPRNLTCLKSCENDYRTAPVAIAISHRNQSELLIRALNSALNQTLINKKIAQIVILDDQSHSLWFESLEDVLSHPSITLLKANCGSPSRSRNTILDWVDAQECISWVARLDADDEFFCNDSLEALYSKAKQDASIAVIGSNALREQGEILHRKNLATPEVLLCPASLIEFVDGFCNKSQQQELPSCNLLLKSQSGIRYPNIGSAEDHWLLIHLLLLHTNKVSIVSTPLYSIYSLDGNSTKSNKVRGHWWSSRKKLAWVVGAVRLALRSDNRFLGYGMEGIVSQNGKNILKHFYPWSMDDGEALRLQAILDNNHLPLPSGRWIKTDKQWLFSSEKLYNEKPGLFIDKTKITTFLESLYRNNVVTLNIKRDNLMFTQHGELNYVDIGKDIKTLTTSYFIDICARMYGIGILGYSDEELVRRKSRHRPDEVLSAIPGFTEFYYNLIKSLHPLNSLAFDRSKPEKISANTTLLIKSCAQDAVGFYEQVEHIVSQLSFPSNFTSKVILIDKYLGPFLRQYDMPNIESLMSQAMELKNNGVIDEILLAPDSFDVISDTYQKWFGTDSVTQTHTSTNAPLYPHIWAFSHIKTRYVLQCDCDILIGRKDFNHDFLADMLAAIKSESILCVGFNIPKKNDDCFDYHGVPGQFPPEVRFGLLDLKKINQILPISNPVENSKFKLTWHRALQHFQSKSRFYSSVRGGDSASFYVHPCNHDKHALKAGVIRDLISQGLYPEQQEEQFDLVADANWKYPNRNEMVIFLMLGRLTSPSKLDRCIKSLMQQQCQDFGVIMIDDASGLMKTWHYPLQLKCFEGRYTLVRNNSHKGYINNFLTAIWKICNNPDSLIVILDQDDFLMQETVVDQLKNARLNGYDLIQMPMFRPNKPLKLYEPNYNNPRSKGGGNTWVHLRAFTKKLFDNVPQDYFQCSEGGWFSTVTDYATMLPMVELAEKPIYLDSGYAYWHERDAYSSAYKEKQESLLGEIITKPRLQAYNIIPAVQETEIDEYFP